MRTRLICLALLAAAVATAEFMMPIAAPTDRLIANTSAHLAEHPEDAGAWYILGRIHYLAFINQAPYAEAFNPDKQPPDIAPDWLRPNFLYAARQRQAQADVLKVMTLQSLDAIPPEKREAFWQAVNQRHRELTETNWRPEPLTRDQLATHAAEAEKAFERALALKPMEGLYHLGLASLWKQVADWAREIEAELPLAAATPDAVTERFRRAYDLAIKQDLKLDERPLAGIHSLVGYEAGKAWLDLTRHTLDEGLKRERAKVEANLAKIQKLPFGAITPIVFRPSLGATRLADLLATDRVVSFDLDGDGYSERRPWVRPDTAFLVWDPARDGRIVSGRQLIGSVTWWLFFDDGYHVLDALDDDRDGWLAGPELDGLRAWFDRNGDALSQPGEVVDLADLQIVGLATRATGRDGASPMHLQGLARRDGAHLPTWDWLAPAAD